MVWEERKWLLAFLFKSGESGRDNASCFSFRGHHVYTVYKVLDRPKDPKSISIPIYPLWCLRSKRVYSI